MENMLRDGVSQSEIAVILKVDKSTVSRERKRQRKNGRYDADMAEHKAKVKRSNSKHQGMKIEGDKELRKLVI